MVLVCLSTLGFRFKNLSPISEGESSKAAILFLLIIVQSENSFAFRFLCLSNQVQVLSVVLDTSCFHIAHDLPPNQVQVLSVVLDTSCFHIAHDLPASRRGKNRYTCFVQAEFGWVWEHEDIQFYTQIRYSLFITAEQISSIIGDFKRNTGLRAELTLPPAIILHGIVPPVTELSQIQNWLSMEWNSTRLGSATVFFNKLSSCKWTQVHWLQFYFWVESMKSLSLNVINHLHDTWLSLHYYECFSRMYLVSRAGTLWILIMIQ